MTSNDGRLRLQVVSMTVFALLLAACGDDSSGPSAAEKALQDLQSKYDELAGDRNPVEWASDDFENIGDWEYKVVDISALSAADLEAELNRHGDDRWEIVWIDESGGGKTAVFKRPAVSVLSKIPLSQLGRLMIGGGEAEQ